MSHNHHWAAVPNCTCRIVHDDMNFFNAVVIIGVLPVIAIIGLIANTVNSWVYWKGQSSAERYLLALSLSDLGVCISGILVIAADSVRAHSLIIDQLFVILLPWLIPFGLFFQMTSIYVTVTAAIDCYIGVCRPWICFPHKERRYCSVKNANRILTMVVVLTAAYNVIQFWELESVKCFSNDMQMILYELCPTLMRLNQFYITFYRGYLYAITMAFFPFATLSILTALILCEMQRRKNANQDIRSGGMQDYTAVTEKPTDESGNAIVLVLVVVLNLGCSFVSLLVNICDMFEDSLSHDVQMALIDIGNLLVVFNATANFIIYTCTSSSYRKQIKELIRTLTNSKKACIDL